MLAQPDIDPIERLAHLHAKKKHTLVGLMSGTSADGVDAAVVDIQDGERGIAVEVKAFYCLKYEQEVRERILGAGSLSLAQLADLDRQLGEAMASAALESITAAGMKCTDVDLVGSHGQTIYHRPPDSRAPGLTLQIGLAAVIAERTGLPVVSDFRSRDMVLGGQGAPLVPLVDHLLFARPEETRILLNLGGIANITAVGHGLDNLCAFDTGPGNALMDALIRLGTGGREAMDRDGAMASRGSVDSELLQELMAEPFFEQKPPRSVDRDVFGETLARRILERSPRGSIEDLLATATVFTAETIAQATRSLPEPHGEVSCVIASGGGVHNPVLMKALEERLSGIPLSTTADHGLNVDAKEAVAFAVLARETILGRSSNVPAATGASRAAVLGTITP